MFTPTVNWIAVSVQYVSFDPVILHAWQNDQLLRMQTNKKKRRKPKTAPAKTLLIEVPWQKFPFLYNFQADCA